jgi:hypothetical protein
VRRLLTLALLIGLPWPAFCQTTVRILDGKGNVVCELTVPTPGSVQVLPGPGPQPVPPIPPPIPPPNPAPPAPVPPPAPLPPPPVTGPAAHVIIIRDDAPGVMSAAQAAALRDRALRDAIEALGLKWHVYAVDSNEVQLMPGTKDKNGKDLGGHGYSIWLPGGPKAQPGVKTTGLFVTDNKGLLVRPGIPLPQDSAGILAAVKAAVGG